MSKGVIIHSTIAFNNAERGGGVYDGKAQRCLIYGNIATDGGGLNYSTAQSCDIRNNTATAKGGGSHNSTLDNCTVVNNNANYAGGIYSSISRNCIVWYNHAPTYTNMGSTTASFTCSPDAQQDSNGNITNCPVFYDWATGDYTLQRSSLCLNAGDNQYAAPTTDMDGEQRVLYGIVDMGAYELNLGSYDSDADGMPDFWELENFGNITIAVATNNPDSDTFENLDEYTAGTNPNDDQSLLRITQSETIKNGAFTQTTLHWDAMEDRIYNILWTTNLVEGFNAIGFSDISYPIDYFIINNESDKSFYKINVRLDD